MVNTIINFVFLGVPGPLQYIGIYLFENIYFIIIIILLIVIIKLLKRRSI